jgi:hypothetical protein
MLGEGVVAESIAIDSRDVPKQAVGMAVSRSRRKLAVEI